MKLPRLLTTTAFALCAGCNSLDNPFASLRIFSTGRDARTFNAQTGQYEWPKDATPRPQSRVARTAAATPAPKDDGRPFDPQRGAWSDPR